MVPRTYEHQKQKCKIKTQENYESLFLIKYKNFLEVQCALNIEGESHFISTKAIDIIFQQKTELKIMWSILGEWGKLTHLPHDLS